MSNSTNGLPFQRKNYLILLIGVIVLAIGFLVMSVDNQAYGFGFLGITLGPILILIGFIIQFFAILWKPKEKK
jgi:uncharacterized membrane-anchored protein YitT (DUF2179 family)